MRGRCFFVPGVPVAKGSAKAFYDPKLERAMVVQTNEEKQKPWASLVSMTAQQYCDEIQTGPIFLELTFFMPRPKSHYGTGRNSEKLKDSAPFLHISKPDLDKLTRCIKDALTGIVYKDDSQVCRLTTRKVYGEQTGVEITWLKGFSDGA